VLKRENRFVVFGEEKEKRGKNREQLIRGQTS
jgi:hypothetical protein